MKSFRIVVHCLGTFFVLFVSYNKIMFWKDNILNLQKPLSLSDVINDAINIAQNSNTSHIIIEDNSVYLGCIALHDLETLDGDSKIGDYKYLFQPIYVLQNISWLDLMEVYSKYDANICPVLSDDHQYLGYYHRDDILDYLNQTPFLKEPGGILIVQKNISDFSMSQVAQIVESNGAKLLGCLVENIDHDQVVITLKMSLGVMNEVIQTFRRYRYEIISEHRDDTYIQNLKERSDYLDLYLNV